MKKANIFTNLLFVLVSVLFVCYLGYHAYGLLNNKTSIVDAVSVTAVDKLAVNGVFLRDQSPVELPAEMSEILISDGEKIGVGQSVALVFNDSVAREQYATYKEAQDKAETIRDSESYAADGVNGAKLSMHIKLANAEYSNALMAGDVEQIKTALTKLMTLSQLQKQTTTAVGVAAAQTMPKEAPRQYSAKDFNAQSVKASQAGYFFSYNDGFDKRFMPDNIENLTSADIAQGIEQSKDVSTDKSGKVITDFVWYYATTVNDEQAKKLKEVNTVFLRFSQLTSADVPARLVSVKNEGVDQNLVIYKSNTMHESILATRSQPCEIIIGSYEGIKIPKQSIRQLNGKWGVYCLSGEKAVFKEIQWIFETDSYYIVKQAESADKGLFEYDKVILSSDLIEN